MKTAALCILLLGLFKWVKPEPAAPPIKSEELSGKKFFQSDFAITTLTTHTIRDITSVVTIPMCTYAARTVTSTTFCVTLLNLPPECVEEECEGERTKRHVPRKMVNIPLLLEEDDAMIQLSPSTLRDIEVAISKPKPRFLNLFPKETSTWVHTVITTVTEIDLISSTTTTVLDSVVVTLHSLSKIYVGGASDEAGLPRCYSAED